HPPLQKVTTHAIHPTAPFRTIKRKMRPISALPAAGPTGTCAAIGGPVMRSGQRQRGYSITEMLTVVAIIGIVSLILVPNFMSMYRIGKMKSATRNFIARVRRVQQQAVTLNRRMRISFTPNTRTYTIWTERTNPTTGVRTWVQQGFEQPLEEAGAANKSGVISFG